MLSLGGSITTLNSMWSRQCNKLVRKLKEVSELKILINLIIEWQLGEHPTASICEWNKNFISPVQDKHVHFMIHKILPYPITKCWHEYSHVQVRCKVLSHKRRFCRHVRLKSIIYPLFSFILLISQREH